MSRFLKSLLFPPVLTTVWCLRESTQTSVQSSAFPAGRVSSEGPGGEGFHWFHGIAIGGIAATHNVPVTKRQFGTRTPCFWYIYIGQTFNANRKLWHTSPCIYTVYMIASFYDFGMMDILPWRVASCNSKSKNTKVLRNRESRVMIGLHIIVTVKSKWLVMFHSR